MDTAALVRIAIVISVMLIGVALGLRYVVSEEGYLLHRPGLLVRSLVAMNIVIPLITVWLVTSFDLKTPVRVALVALALSPLPPFLPGKHLRLASHAYIYGIEVAAAVCSIVLVPLTVAIFSTYFHTRLVSAGKVFLVVMVTILVPLAIGLIIQRVRPTHAERLAATVHKVGIALLLVACVPVVVVEWPDIRSLLGDGTVIAMIAFSALGLLVGHILGGPDLQNRSVLALATSSRHPGVALVVAGTSFQAPRLIMAALILAFVVSSVVGVPYIAWRKRVHAATASAALAGSR